jgi:hypothetical protein
VHSLPAVADASRAERRPIRESSARRRQYPSQVARGSRWMCQFGPSAEHISNPGYPSGREVSPAVGPNRGIHGRCRRCTSAGGGMKFATHPGGRRVSAREVRLVLGHARPNSGRQWAAFFHVHPQTIKVWMARGFVLGLWSGPSRDAWTVVQREAMAAQWNNLKFLEGEGCRLPEGNLLLP